MMFPIAQCLVMCLMSAISTDAGVGGDDPDAYLSKGDGPKRLTETVVLREEQSGIAGTTGTIRTVEPDGKWRLDVFRRRGGKEEATTTKTGRLSPAELTALAKDLASHDLLGLPEKVGVDEPVNPHKIILQFGKKRVALSGIAPRVDEDETTKARILKSASDHGVAGDKVWTRCAHLSQAVESRVAPPKN